MHRPAGGRRTPAAPHPSSRPTPPLPVPRAPRAPEQAPGAAERGGQLGPFKRKCVILAILETDGRTHATAALGRVVIDLSEFASIDGQELRTFTVACNKGILAAVGEPQLTITLRCRWKKVRGWRGRGGGGSVGGGRQLATTIGRRWNKPGKH